MSQPPVPSQSARARAQIDREARLAREAIALRENLRRRKQQARAREDAPPTPPDSAPGPDPI